MTDSKQKQPTIFVSRYLGPAKYNQKTFSMQKYFNMKNWQKINKRHNMITAKTDGWRCLYKKVFQDKVYFNLTGSVDQKIKLEKNKLYNISFGLFQAEKETIYAKIHNISPYVNVHEKELVFDE